MPAKHVTFAFNKASAKYNTSCALQIKTGERLIDLLKRYSKDTDTILDAGCGTGLITKKMASTFSFKKFYAIDLAEKLLEQATNLLSDFRVETLLADYNNLDFIQDTCHIIYANLSLHWSENFFHTLHTFYNKLHPGGLLGFSVPLPGTFDEIKPYCAINEFCDLLNIQNALEKNSFKICYSKQEDITLPFENLVSALKHIKSVGANYVPYGLRKNTSLKALGKEILKNTSHPFQLTYYIGYFICYK